jgi:hypothetical protein
MKPSPAPLLLSLLLLALSSGIASGQALTAESDSILPQAPTPGQTSNQAPDQTPGAGPAPKPLSNRPPQTPVQAAEALRISKLAIVNGKPYDQPSTRDTLINYANDTYLLPAAAGTTVRALYAQVMGKPEEWNFWQRLGSSYGVTIIDGNVRLAMELTFHEDLRYIPCHGCTVKAKIENALLSEITARHDVDGHRFFTLTPIVADFSGPIIAHSYWYPNGFNPFAGVVATRTVFAVRIGQHLFREFVIERRHHDPHYENEPKRPTPAAAAL